MKSYEQFKAAPDQAELTPEEQNFLDLQKRLVERVGYKEGDGGWQLVGKTLRAALSADGVKILLNQQRREDIERKIAETKPAILNATHAEANKINEQLEHLTSRVKSAKAGVQAASENYSAALDELEAFQEENLK